MTKQVLTVGGKVWIETKAGSGEYKPVHPFAVFKWTGTYDGKLSDARRFFATEKAAERFCRKFEDGTHYVRTSALCEAA